MDIKYFNERRWPITELELQDLDSYVIDYLFNGKVQKSERYELNELDSYDTYYYANGTLKKTEGHCFKLLSQQMELVSRSYRLDSCENLNDVTQSLLEDCSFLRVYFNSQHNKQGDSLWQYKVYQGKQFKYEGFEAFDQQDRIIAQCVKERATNKYYSKRKYFYGDPAIFDGAFDGAPAMKFEYGEIGETPHIACDSGIFMDCSYSLDNFIKEQRLMDVFPWDKHVYYHSFEPMLP
jgi:hypothetical protein